VRTPLSPRAGRPAAAALALAVALTSLAPFAAAPEIVTGIARAAGASPAASTIATAAPEAGDTRSSGEGAGLAGAPLVAVGIVLAIGAASAAATLAYVRLTSSTAAPR
jgi:hypothetical protein